MSRGFLVLTLWALIAGCSEDHDDIRRWMQEASRDLKGKVQPLPEIKSYPLASYEAGELIDPFQPSKIEPDKKPSGALMPDLNRPKEPLEAYPLESLTMVGTLAMDNMTHALVQADKTLHRVKIGNYMGQNFGMIVDITESEVVLKELVQEGSGGYVERTSALQLQETREAKGK